MAQAQADLLAAELLAQGMPAEQIAELRAEARAEGRSLAATVRTWRRDREIDRKRAIRKGRRA